MCVLLAVAKPLSMDSSPLSPSLLLGVRWLATTVGACSCHLVRGLTRCVRSVILWVITLPKVLHRLINYLAEYRYCA
jgi:hypothetical protein